MDARETVLYWDSEADALSKNRKKSLRGRGRTRWEKALSVLFPPDMPLHILDAGCGSGFLSVILTGLGHNVIGIDISPVMIQCAYETASSSGKRIEYRIMDCAKTDFEDENFDAVVCCEVMSHMPDARPVWAEFRRILKREGHAVIFDTNAILVEQAQAQGFSHCRFPDFAGLEALNGEDLHSMSARKPLKDEFDIIPQIALFKRHIQTAKKQMQLYQNWCQNSGMQFPEYTVLNIISHHPKGFRPSDISAALVIPPQTLTRILAALQNDGLIYRQVNENDRRSAVVTITEAGLNRIKPLQSAIRRIEESALSGYGIDELTKFSELSENLLHSLDSAFRRDVNGGLTKSPFS